MIDIHSHVLFGIDDGAKTCVESLAILDEMIAKGTTDLVLTPHYMSGYKTSTNDRIKLFNELKDKAKSKNINLYLGNEVFLFKDILKALKSKKVSTINNSKYVLVEFPLHNDLHYASRIIFDMINDGYIPIIAHPERYKRVQRDISSLDVYLNMGALLQCNYASMFGKYGWSSRRVVKTLLKQRKVTLMAGDVHKCNSSYDSSVIYKKLYKIVKDDSYVNNLLVVNPKMIIDNKEI